MLSFIFTDQYPAKFKFIFGVLGFNFLVSLTQGNAQVLLQLEIPHQIEAVKFGAGSKINFKSKDRPDEWQNRTIENIIYGENILIFEDGMLALEDITHFRLHNSTAKAFGKLFMGFGSGWFMFGTIAAIAGKFTFTAGTLGIGGVAVGVGLLLHNVVSRRTFKIGKNGNLRIIDISFPAVLP